jgi:hypothetical protein
MGISEAVDDLREMVTAKGMDRHARRKVFRLVERGEAAPDARGARLALAWARTSRRGTDPRMVALLGIVAIYAAVQLVVEIANTELDIETGEHGILVALGVYTLLTWRSRRDAAIRAEAANRRVLEQA